MSKREFKILTYNIFLRPPGVANHKNDFKSERLSHFVETMKDYDIICLQEIFDQLSFRKTKLIRAA
jgi:endonuclease/exonuclease/phosphatase family metal-dependent hydrolase